MKRVILLLLAIVMTFSLASCDLIDIIEDSIDSSDGTKAKGSDGCDHIDEDDDGYCDYCDISWKKECTYHVDEDDDEKCDYCGNAFAKVVMKAPELRIDDEGRISWLDNLIDRYCYEYIVSVNGKETTIRSVYIEKPIHGAVYKVKALVHNPKGMYLDSEWSKEFTFGDGRSYDFFGCGFSGAVEDMLIKMAEKPNGCYSLGSTKYTKCENGDFIIDAGNKVSIFSLSDYTLYIIHNKKYYEKTCYTREWKTEYYSALCVDAAGFNLIATSDAGSVANATAYLANNGISLLSAGTDNGGVEGKASLSKYTEYTNTVNNAYLFTTYMHPQTRKFDWLKPYANKIQSWTVEYIDKVWLEDNVSVVFTAELTDNELKEIYDFLLKQGMKADAGTMLTGTVKNFSGHLPVYHMNRTTEEDEWWNDDYRFAGMSQNGVSALPLTLKVKYLYLFTYDGGSFATYVRKKDGLYRATPDTAGEYVIDKDGNRTR